MSLQPPLLLFSDSECKILAETLQNPTTCTTSFFVSCASSRLQILDCPVRQQGFTAIQSDDFRACRPVYGEIAGSVKYYVNQKCIGTELSVGVLPLNSATAISPASSTTATTTTTTTETAPGLPVESKSPLSPLAVIGISIAATIFFILLTAIIIRKLSRPNRLRRKPKFNTTEPDSAWQFPVIVKLDSLDLLDNPLDGYDPVDTTSHTVLPIAGPDTILPITESEDDITTIEEPIVTTYKSLLHSASDLIPLLKLPNPHNLTTHLSLYHQGILIKTLVKAFNSTLETDSRLKSLYKHIWYGTDQLDFKSEWDYCIDAVHKSISSTYGIEMLGFVKEVQQFYEKYHLDKVKFIYTIQTEQVDLEIHRVVGSGTGNYISLVPGLMRNGNVLIKEVVCAI